MFRSQVKKSRYTSIYRKRHGCKGLESLEERRLLAAVPVTSVLHDAGGGTVTNTANITSITVGGNTYTTLVAPSEAVLQNAPPEAFDFFWGTSGTEPTDTLEALGGFDMSTGVLNPNSEGPANMIFSQAINDLDGTDPELFIFDPGAGAFDELWTVQAIVGGTAASPVLGGTPFNFGEADFGPDPSNVGFQGSFQRNTGADFTQDVRGVAFDLGDLGLFGGTLIGLQVTSDIGDPAAIIGRVDSIAAPPVITGGTGPGGVELANGSSNLENWFRADAGVVTSGDDVTAWRDQSGRGDDATAIGPDNPTLVNSATINNQPTVRFVKNATADDLGFAGVSHASGNDFSFFAVVQPEDGRDIGSEIGFVLGSTANGNDVTKVGPWTGNGFFRRIAHASPNPPSNIATWPNAPGTTEPARIIYLQRDPADEMTSGFDGANPNSPATVALTSRINRIGGPTNSSTTQDFPGDVAELAFFGDTLNIAERHIVANYLSAKYNIPLDTASGGLNIYTGDDPTQGDYDLDAFGIGRADASNLLNNTGSAGLGLRASDASLNDGEFAMAGHEIPVNSIVSTNVPAGIDSRWERVWYVDTNGGTLDVDMAFGFANAGLPAASDGIEYSLLRASTDGGPFTIVDTQMAADGQAEFAVNAVQTGYYTIGIPAGTLLTADDAYNADEATALSVDAASGVMSNDTLPVGSTLIQAQGMALSGGTVSVTSDQGAPVTVNSDGSFDYDPSGLSAFFLQPGETATDTFTYTVDDGNGSTASGSVTITVTGQFGAIDDSYSTVEGQLFTVAAAGGLLANDPLPPGATLTEAQGMALSGGSVSVTSDQGAAVTVNDDGSFSFDPTGVAAFSLPPGATLIDTFSYTVDEGTGDIITATVSVTVSGTAGPVDDSLTVNNSDLLNVPAPGVLGNDAGVLPYADVVTASDPLLYWRLGEADKSAGATAVNSAAGPSSVGAAGDGTYADAVGNVDPGAIAGSADTAASFGSTTAGGTTGDSVQVDFGPIATPFPASQLTLEIWLRSTSTANTMAILSSDSLEGTSNNESLLFLNGDDLNFYVQNNPVATGVTRGQIIDGDWHHLVLTYDATGGANNLRTYVDGEEHLATSTGSFPDNGIFVLAQESDMPGGGFADSQKFIGDLDEFAIYNRTLPQQEVQSHFLSAPATMAAAVLSAQGTALNGGSVTVASDQGATVTINDDGSFQYDSRSSATLQNLPLGTSATDTFSYTIDDGNSQLELATVTVTVSSIPRAVSDTGSTDEETAITVAAPGVIGNDQVLNYVDQVQDSDPVFHWRLGEADKTDGQTAVNSATGSNSIGTAGDGLYRGAIGNVTDGALPNSTNEAASFGVTSATGSAGDRVVQSAFSGTFPTTEITIESWVRGLSADNLDPSIFSYAVSGQSNEVLLISQSDTWRVFLHGTARDTGVPESALLDGQWHHVAITWDSATGVSRFYIDGSLLHTETNHEQGDPLNATGSFALAQEQDSADGGFANDQKLVGDLDEVAIYNRALPGSELQTHYLSAPSLAGQVTGFQATSDLGATVVVNADGSYSYDPSGSAALNALAAGEQAIDSFTYTATTGDNRVAAWTFPVEHGAAVETGSSFSPDLTAAGVTVSPIQDMAGNLTIETISDGTAESAPYFRIDPDANSVDLAEAVANDKYAEFTVIPDSSQPLNLQSLQLVAARSGGSEPRGFAIFSSADGFALGAHIGTVDNIPAVRSNFTPYRFDLSGAQFQNLTGPVTFRIYAFSPADNNGVEFDDLTIFSADSAVDTATVSMTVTGVNDAPTPMADTAAADENGGAIPIDVLANDSDPDTNGTAPDDTLSLDSVDDTGTLGMVSISGGMISYDPAGQFENLPSGATATDTFSYTVIDNNGATAATTVTVTITGANDPPAGVDDAAMASEDGPVITIDVLANDSDDDIDGTAPDDTLTITAIDTTGTSGLVTNNGGDIGYNPNGQFESLSAGEMATDTFSYTFEDAAGLSSTAMVVVTVTGQNDPVTNVSAGGPYGPISEGDSLSLQGSFDDLDANDSYTYSWDINGDGVFGDADGLNPTTLTFAQLQALGIDDGPATFNVSFRVDDGGGAVTSAASALLTLENAPPVADIEGPDEGVLGISIDFTLIATDPSLADQNAGFTFEVHWGDGTSEPFSGTSPLTVSHEFQSFGLQTIMVTATDKDGGESLVATHEIDIVPVAVVGDDLQATGTGGSDRIIFYPAVAGVQVRYNNVTYPTDGGAFDFSGQIMANGLGSADQMIISGGLGIPAVFDGGEGNDYLAGGLADDTISGGAGNDIVLAGEGNNSLVGGSGNDRLEGRDGLDVIFGGSGNDRLNGGGGNDILDGGDDNDFLFGGPGDDLLAGRGGADTLNGHFGNDVVLGGTSSDQLFGGDGQDLLLGGTGIDRLRGDGGDDDLIGGSSELDGDIEAALDAMMATLGTDLATADANAAMQLGEWFTSGNDRDGFGALDDSDGSDDLTGGAGADEFHSETDRIRDQRSDDSAIT